MTANDIERAPDGRLILRIEIPEPEPEPPDADCLLCGGVVPGWRTTLIDIPVCAACEFHKGTGGCYLHFRVLESAPLMVAHSYHIAAAVLWHLETEIAKSRRNADQLHA